MYDEQHVDTDTLAIAGYEYSAGRGGVPPLSCQLSVDAFNAGITNRNGRNGTHVSEPQEGMKSTHSGPLGRADKELAILGSR
jgi:hypothetical protein